jgi:hypothetical protein
LTRLYVRVSGLIAVICVVLCATLSALGSTQPANPVLEGFRVGCEEKPQPCWYGIVPGVTTEAEAETLLQLIPSQPSNFSASVTFSPYNTAGEARVVYQISVLFRPEERIMLGEVIAVLGSPEWMDVDTIYVVPDENILYENGITASVESIRSPFSPVYKISLREGQIPYQNWHGFIARWRYCELEPGYTICQQP